MSLPVFVYHPDPVATGSVKASETACCICGQARGYIYAGPVYSQASLDDSICPWCIADGTAHERFDAQFTDIASIGGEPWEDVSEAIAETVAFRTPGFSGWQQERWWTHCGDAAIFRGVAGWPDLQAAGESAIAAIAADVGLAGEKLDNYLRALSRTGSITAYLFQCRHCGTFGGYSDCD